MLSNEYQWMGVRNNIACVMLWFWLHVSKFGCNLFDVESLICYKLILCHGMTPVYDISVICLYDLLFCNKGIHSIKGCQMTCHV